MAARLFVCSLISYRPVSAPRSVTSPARHKIRLFFEWLNLRPSSVYYPPLWRFPNLTLYIIQNGTGKGISFQLRRLWLGIPYSTPDRHFIPLTTPLPFNCFSGTNWLIILIGLFGLLRWSWHQLHPYDYIPCAFFNGCYWSAIPVKYLIEEGYEVVCFSKLGATLELQIIDFMLIKYAVADVGQEGIVEADSEAMRPRVTKWLPQRTLRLPARRLWRSVPSSARSWISAASSLRSSASLPLLAMPFTRTSTCSVCYIHYI